jgi:hypothetical protein
MAEKAANPQEWQAFVAARAAEANNARESLPLR